MVRSKLLDISSTIILIEANKYNQKSNKNIILTIGTLPVEFLILSVDKRLILPDRYYYTLFQNYILITICLVTNL